MKARNVLLLLGAVLLAASCTSTGTLPAVTPRGEERFLVDPRIGYPGAIDPQLNKRFGAAWREVISGNDAEARRRLDDILRQGEFLPALLAEAALDIRAGRFDAARQTVDLAEQRAPGYLAARVYEAEIAAREGQTRLAYDLYHEIASVPGAPPTVVERLASLREAVFNDLVASARGAADVEAVALLREALTIEPAAVEPRVALAQRLIAQKQYEDARREIDPLLDSVADRADVQEVLAEIEVGRGRYQEAIVRLDRLARRTKDPRFAQRLEEIKVEWSAANMPTHFRSALQSQAVTRAELATLLYWTVPSVRFAQNLASPPIAVDIEDVAGREEIIRAIALGLFDVDPVTRIVSPYRQITAARLSTYLARILTLRAAPCARGLTLDRILAACQIPDPLTAHPPDATVSGREAQAALEEIAKALQ